MRHRGGATMKCDVSDEFEPLDVKAEPLVIHRRPGGIPPNLVVFVHGLGGSRYGTWGSFPKFLFNDFKQDGLDVGLYSYRTAFHRLRLTASIDLEREATVLADAIRDLPSDYRRVILIAHSMGGLLIKAAVTSLIDRDEREALARTAGLILMATPQAGSVRVPRFLGSFSRDARALKPHGELVTRITEIFTDRVSQLPVPDDPRRFVIPVWAVLSPEDLWVDRLSAGLQIPSQRRKEVRGSHTSIVKPEDILDDAYQFVKKAIATCLKPAVGPEGPTNPAPGPAIHPGVTGTTGTTAPDAFLSVVQSQITQVPISMHLPGPLSQIGSQPPVFGMQLAWIGGGQSPAALTQEQVKPRIDELFEVITAPEEVSSALFQTEQAAGLAPYDVDRINAREGVADVQQALETALRQAKGRLLICGPR